MRARLKRMMKHAAGHPAPEEAAKPLTEQAALEAGSPAYATPDGAVEPLTVSEQNTGPLAGRAVLEGAT